MKLTMTMTMTILLCTPAQLVGAGEGDDYDESDPMLLEYQRRKAEEAGLVSGAWRRGCCVVRAAR